MRISMQGLGLGPGDSCYDPQHPWYLPNLMHTAYECQCMANQKRNPEDLCVFAMPGGTPTEYKKPDNVPSVVDVVLETPGWLAGGAAQGAAKVVGTTVSETAGGVTSGLVGSLDWRGYAAIAVAGVVAFYILTKR